jgi:hypothetical protein
VSTARSGGGWLLSAKAILRGAAIETPDEVRFDQAIVEFSHLGEWATLTGMTETMETIKAGPFPSNPDTPEGTSLYSSSRALSVPQANQLAGLPNQRERWSSRSC